MMTSFNPWHYVSWTITGIAGYITHTKTDDWSTVVLVVCCVGLACSVFSLWYDVRLSRVDYGQQVQAIVVADWGQKGRRIKDDIPEHLSGVVFHFVPARLVRKTVQDIEAKLADASNKYYLQPHGEEKKTIPIESFYFRDPKTGNVNETQEAYEATVFTKAGEANHEWLAYLRENAPDLDYVNLFFTSHRNGSVL